MTAPVRLSVAPSGDRLLAQGRPFLYCADTAWAAFGPITEAEWRHYLRRRRDQGFNAVQISVLPVLHDTSRSPDDPAPFAPRPGGGWDLDRPSEAYWAAAERKVAVAVEMGLVPALVVLWCTYVEGTRCAAVSPWDVSMSEPQVVAHARRVADRFGRLCPLFFVSGDTRFEAPLESPRYMAALDALRAACPDALLAMHLNWDVPLPPEFAAKVNIYAYQSGQRLVHQERPWKLAQDFLAMPVRRPIVNAEPSYEGHLRVGDQTRWSAFDVRRAVWQSLLSGAKAGIAYGAAGVWSFHRAGMAFPNEARAGTPFDWEDGLDLPGAWDVGFARWLWEALDLGTFAPAQDLLLDADPQVRAAATTDRRRLAIYAPHATPLRLAIPPGGATLRAIDLEARRIHFGQVADLAVVPPPFNADALLLVERG